MTPFQSSQAGSAKEGKRPYCVGRYQSSTLKLTFAPKVSNTFKIVLNLEFVILFSIFEI